MFSLAKAQKPHGACEEQAAGPCTEDTILVAAMKAVARQSLPGVCSLPSCPGPCGEGCAVSVNRDLAFHFSVADALQGDHQHSPQVPNTGAIIEQS